MLALIIKILGILVKSRNFLRKLFEKISANKLDRMRGDVFTIFRVLHSRVWWRFYLLYYWAHLFEVYSLYPFSSLASTLWYDGEINDDKFHAPRLAKLMLINMKPFRLESLKFLLKQTLIYLCTYLHYIKWWAVSCTTLSQ